MMLYKDITIGETLIKGNIFLAPTAGYSDKPFREICSQMGSSLNFTEMVSSEALIRDNAKTKLIMERADSEKNYAIQIFTGSPESASKSVEKISSYYPTLIDINCGCPVPKILKSGAGSDLMKTPKKIGEIIEAIKKVTNIPVSIKIRSGFTEDSINFLECGKIAQESGAALVSLHPRTRSQGYSGKARWEHIGELKSKLTIPVIGSGDLYTPWDVQNMLLETGADGVMIARGSFGNPFIFKNTINFLRDGIPPVEPTLKEILTIALKHLNLNVNFYPENVALKEIKKHLCAYSKGFPGAKDVRDRLMRCHTYKDFTNVFNDLLGNDD